MWPDDASAQVQIGVVGGDITTVTDPTGSPDPTVFLATPTSTWMWNGRRSLFWWGKRPADIHIAGMRPSAWFGAMAIETLFRSGSSSIE